MNPLRVVLSQTRCARSLNPKKAVAMETRLHLPEFETPSAITEVLSALKSQKLVPKHDKKDWGDWIYLKGYQTVISIESMRGLAKSATLEFAEGEDDALELKLIAAFRSLGWYGTDEDGEYPL